jgi:chromosome partitioning protein
MRVLSFVNHTGGCGKTTSAIHLAGALAQRGSRVHLIDLDPQAHATMGLSSDAEERASMLEVLTDRVALADIVHAAPGGIALAPSHARLAEFEELAARRLGSERALHAILAKLDAAYDDVLIDCPPRADGTLTANALCASTHVVLVVETGAFALQGAVRALRFVREAAHVHGSAFDVRVLATLFESRQRIARELLVAMHSRFGPSMFDTAVRSSARLREAAAVGVPIQVLSPRSSAAHDFAALAEEVSCMRPSAGARDARPAGRVRMTGARR